MRFSIAPFSSPSGRWPHARAALLSAACVTLLGLAAPLSAQTIGVYVGDSARIELAPGAKLTVPLRADLQSAGGASIASLQGRLGWSSSRLTLDSIRAISGWTLTANQDSVAVGRLAFSTFGTAVLPASGPVATAYFTASATSGGTRIAFSPEAIGDEAGNSVMPLLQVRGQDVCVGITGKWGDVTEDGVVSVMDAQQIARSTVALAISRPAALAARGDVSADGAINIIDAQQIARFGVGLSASARVNVTITPAPTVSSLLLTTVASAVLVPGNTVQLSAEPRDGTGASVAGCPPMAWSSSNPTVATVNGSGLITVLTSGAVTITASSGGVSASSALTIGALPIAGESITAGVQHTCALTRSGRAYCWGYNQDFQLGNGTTQFQTEPVPVSTELSFIALSAGDHHTCGLSTARAVYCWGEGANGRIGDGAASRRGAPTRINSPLTFSRVAAGREFTCALSDAGAAFCWGRNFAGQLGDGGLTDRLSPTPVQGGLIFTSIEAGYRHVCALTAAGAAYCWGNNDDGYLGDGSKTARFTPTLVSGGLQFAEISAGTYHSCGRTTAGAAVCWGSGGSGQLGTGVNASYAAPTPVAGALTWRQITTGNQLSCGVTTGGALFCWGDNTWGAVGDGTRTNRLSPVAVLSGTASVTVGQQGHTCAIMTAGTAQCWGWDYDGSLGQGNLRPLTPTVVAGAPALTAAAGNYHAQSFCGLIATGAVTCWGRNEWNTFGAPTTVVVNETPVAGAQGVTLRSISGGGYHACGVAATNQGYCWGANWYGTYGSGNLNWFTTPVAVAGGLLFAEIEAGENHNCALTTTNSAYCWGLATDGRLGNGATSGNALEPSPVSSSLAFMDITSGNQHSCAVAVGGAAYCWGLNSSGQLGDGSFTSSSAPVAVGGGLTFSRIEAGFQFSCGLLTNGSIACWGAGGERLGNGTTTTRTTPTLISSSLTFTRLEVMTDRACALTAGGELYCWGLNNRGQLGTGNFISASVPVRIGTRTYTAISGTTITTCAIGTDTQTYCWGDNAYGQAGQRHTLTPQPVLGGLTFRTP